MSALYDKMTHLSADIKVGDVGVDDPASLVHKLRNYLTEINLVGMQRKCDDCFPCDVNEKML